MKHKIMIQYTAVSLAAMVGLAFALGFVVNYTVKDHLIKMHINIYPLILQSYAEGNPAFLRLFDSNGDVDKSGSFDFLAAIRNELKMDAVFRMKVWNKEGQVLWSDAKAIVGKTFEDNALFKKAIGGQVSYEIASPDKDENSEEKLEGTVLEIYAPVRIGGAVVGVVELYERDADLHRMISRDSWLLWLIIFIAGILLYSALFFIFWGANRNQRKTLKELEQTQDVTIFALAYQAELRDNETGKHLERTAEYVRILATELRKNPRYTHYLTQKYIDDLVKSTPLHDIGKVGIPDHILRKPGRLTEEEYAHMKLHCELGVQVISRATEHLPFQSFLDIASQLAGSHHERWDGNGYPKGLSGTDIPLSGRIMAVADVYDALRSKRVYKESFPHEKCVEIIRAESGKHFDPDIVGTFLKNDARFKEISERMADE